MKGNLIRLRELTGAGVMDCKKALDECGGDFDKAVLAIQERGIVKAEKKSSRQTGAAILESYIHNNRVGVLLELRCETDFVVRSEPFRALAKDLVLHIAAMDPQTTDDLLRQAFVKDESITVEQLIKNVIARTGENIQVGRFCRYEV